ncbi:Ankyrin repeat protein, partial [Globisporangium splendens]
MELLSPAVRAVCDRHEAAVDLVMSNIHAFLDVSPLCSFMHAGLEGHLHLLKRLHTRHPTPFDGCCEETMDSAAEFGHLDVVQWLHKHREEGCTTDAMDMSAGNGHLDVVQWLHEHREEGCTTNAMDFAAQNGHLEVVQWLHEHRQEGCTSDAMDNAATNGHLHVMQWLHDNRSEGCTKSAFVNACYMQHYDIAVWLLTYRRRNCRSEDLIHNSACRSFLCDAKWRNGNAGYGEYRFYCLYGDDGDDVENGDEDELMELEERDENNEDEEDRLLLLSDWDQFRRRDRRRRGISCKTPTVPLRHGQRLCPLGLKVLDDGRELLHMRLELQDDVHRGLRSALHLHGALISDPVFEKPQLVVRSIAVAVGTVICCEVIVERGLQVQRLLERVQVWRVEVHGVGFDDRLDGGPRGARRSSRSR